MSRRIHVLGFSVLALVACPGAAAEGITASVAAAIEKGDEPALARITGGAIYSKLTVEARSGEIVRMTPAQLIELTRGCAGRDPVEPGSTPDSLGRGMVGFRCEDRPVEPGSCNDVGYGLFVRPMGDYHRLEVWQDERRSRARCGVAVPHPSPRPLPVRPN